jgi:hypothetical protein
MKIARIHNEYGIEVHGRIKVRLSTIGDAREWLSPRPRRVPDSTKTYLACPACGEPASACYLSCLDVCPDCGSRLTEGGCVGEFVGLPTSPDQLTAV